MRTVIRHLRNVALLRADDRLSDGELLRAFLERRDEAAFEALVRRLGPMVLGVCRRVLHNEADVEDAFQATFVVLVRKAPSLRSREQVGNWVYGVARRTAMKARVMSARRRLKESEAVPAAARHAGEEELLRRLDDELAKLPDKYRDAVLMCDLGGKTRKEAALALGVAEGTMSSRLTTARQLLARRLARHGALSAGALAALVAGRASARVPAPLIEATFRAATGATPAHLAPLVHGVMKAMLLNNLKIGAWLVVAALSVGAAALAQPGPRPAPKTDELPAKKVTRPAGDDIEALRHEIEALRLDLKATRERVKQLETEVRGPRSTAFNPAQNAHSAAAMKAQLDSNQSANPYLDVQKTFENAYLARQIQSAVKNINPKIDDEQLAKALQQALDQVRVRQRPPVYNVEKKPAR